VSGRNRILLVPFIKCKIEKKKRELPNKRKGTEAYLYYSKGHTQQQL
jgi:hypothetical protein